MSAPAYAFSFPLCDLLICEFPQPAVVDRVVTLSENLTRSIVVSAARPDDARLRAMTKRMLRLVTERKPVPVLPDPNNPQYLLAYVTETLECGHQIDFFPVADPLIARRRNCPQCADVSRKKPVQSVRFPARNKEAA